MIITRIVEYLSGALEVPVYAEVPEARPDAPLPSAFVVVEKTGSTEQNHIKTANVAVQSWADSMLEAYDLNYEVKAAMRDFLELPSISSVRCTNDYNWTDDRTKQYRMQAMFDVIYY